MSDTDAATEIVNDAIYWRGLFIQRYSGIEFALTDLLVRARHHPNYNRFGDLPRFHAGKLKRLEELIGAPGPLSSFAEPIGAMLTTFRDLEDTRHFIAHAIMATPRNARDPRQLCFSMYRHQDGAVHQGLLFMSLSELIAVVEAIAPTSRQFTALVGEIVRDIPLPKTVSPEDAERIRQAAGPQR